MKVHPDRVVPGEHVAQLVVHPLGQEHRDPRADPDDLDVGDLADAADDRLEELRGERQAIATQDADVTDLRRLPEALELGLRLPATKVPRRQRRSVPVFGPPSRKPDAGVVLVAVPAYNEERFIGSVVHEVRMLGYECLVIDDGSSDRTAAIASAAGAMVERHEHNGGKSAALNAAFTVARERGVSILVVMDGDWQHDPLEIDDLIGPLRAGTADTVSGSRFLRAAGGHVPSVRAIGMRALTLGSSVVSGQPMTDSLSGFRAFGRAAIEAFQFKSHGFSVEFEMQFMTRDLGLRHREVPITARYDDPPRRNVFAYGAQSLDGLLRLTARFRPLLFFGVPSTIVLLMGILAGLVVVDTYQRTTELAAGFALLTVLLIILGSLGLFASVLLHALRGIFLDLDTRLKALATSMPRGADSR